MEHATTTRHTYYAPKDDAARITAYLIRCEYWFEGCVGTGGDYAITCAVEPDQIERGTGLTLAADAA